MSWFSKARRKIFKKVRSAIPKEIRGLVPKEISKPLEKALGISQQKPSGVLPATPEVVAPTYTTTSSVTAGGPAANRVTSYQTPLGSPQQAAPIQIGTSSEPQAMKLQQTASPYAAANVAAQSQAQAAQQQQQEQKPLNQFMAPSMQGIKFGGS